jgi:hypothetical protein
MIGTAKMNIPHIEFHTRFTVGETRSLFGVRGFRADRFRDVVAFADAVPPGNYWLQATTYNPSIRGRVAVSVTAGGPNVFELPVGPPPVVRLDVAVPPGFDRNAIRIGLHDADDPGAPLADSNTRLSQGEQTDPSKITLSYPGRYWLVTRTELCPTSASVGTFDLLAQPLRIRAGETMTLHLKFDKNCATVEGRVMDGAKAAPGARVAVLLSGSPQDPGDVLVDTAGDEGEFRFTGMSAGNCWLWAWRRDDEANGKIESLARIASQGRMVRATVGETKSVVLRLLQVPRPEK